MRISDWSSDVCSSDLAGGIAVERQVAGDSGGQPVGYAGMGAGGGQGIAGEGEMAGGEGRGDGIDDQGQDRIHRRTMVKPSAAGKPAGMAARMAPGAGPA